MSAESNTLAITAHVAILLSDMEFNAIRAQGAGGQNVNKVSTAIHLRFDINKSALPGYCKSRLRHVNDYRISSDGVINIKAQSFRSQEQNREDAIQRLVGLIQKALVVQKPRRATKPSRGSVTKRLDSKTKRGHIKKLRDKQSFQD